jgi:hypothetical protein
MNRQQSAGILQLSRPVPYSRHYDMRETMIVPQVVSKI